MAKNQLPLCDKAFSRLVEGTPNNLEFIGQTITAALVSKEAGLDKGYLKKDRLTHKYLTDQIDAHNKKQKEEGVESTILELKRKLKKAENLTKGYKAQRETFLNSAVFLNGQVFKLENQIAELEKLNKLK